MANKVSLIPSWKSALSILIPAIQGKNLQGQAAARKELYVMAGALDDYCQTLPALVDAAHKAIAKLEAAGLDREQGGNVLPEVAALITALEAFTKTSAL